MDALIQVAKTITGKNVTFAADTWLQTEDTIIVPQEDKRGLIHEILHWVVASDEERTWPNLALDDDVKDILKQDPSLTVPEAWNPNGPFNTDNREAQAAYLEALLAISLGLTTEKYEAKVYGSSVAYDVFAYHLKRVTKSDILWATERLLPEWEDLLLNALG